MLPDIPTVHVQLQELLHLGFDPLDEVEVLSLLSFHGCVVMFSAFRSVDSHLSSNKDGARLDRTGEPLLSLGEVRDEGPNNVAVLVEFLVVHVIVVHEVSKSSIIVELHHGIKLRLHDPLHPLYLSGFCFVSSCGSLSSSSFSSSSPLEATDILELDQA